MSLPDAVARPWLASGDQLGDFTVLERIGRGGMAALYRGYREGVAGFQREVAIKVIHPDLAADPNFVRMFIDEAKLAAQVQHPNVVRVEELGMYEGKHFLVMEYVPGMSVIQLMRVLDSQDQRIGQDMAVHIALAVLGGLHAAHEALGRDGKPLRLIHRDVSPQNILLARTGHIKLIDFGIAKAMGRSQRTRTGHFKGKYRYMAPEQIAGREIDRRVDIYAMGVVLWEMLAMRRLFSGVNVLSIVEQIRHKRVPRLTDLTPDVSPRLADLVDSALSRNRENRPATAREFRTRLAEACPNALKFDAVDLAQLFGAHPEVTSVPAVASESISIELGSLAGSRSVEPSVPVSLSGVFDEDLEESHVRESAMVRLPDTDSRPAEEARRGPAKLTVAATVLVAIAAIAVAVLSSSSATTAVPDFSAVAKRLTHSPPSALSIRVGEEFVAEPTPPEPAQPTLEVAEVEEVVADVSASPTDEVSEPASVRRTRRRTARGRSHMRPRSSALIVLDHF